MTGLAGVRFWRETKSRYNLTGNKCGVCGTVYFPPRPVCTRCHRESIGRMEESRLKGTGEVLTWTLVHEPRPDFEIQVPYILAIVRLDEGPAILAQLVDCAPGQVAIGTRVHSVFRKIGEEGKSGVIYYGYKFVPD
jgi:uncharacterized OB-fold protein